MKLFIIVLVVAAIGLLSYLVVRDTNLDGAGRAVRTDTQELGHDAKRGVEEGVDATKRVTSDAVDAVK